MSYPFANMVEKGRMKGESKIHVVAVPFVAQGHLIPFVELAKRLASLGVLVSYVTTPANAKRLEPQFQGSAGAGIRVVSMAYTIPSTSPAAATENTDTAATVDNVVQHMMTWHLLSEPFATWLRTEVEKEVPGDYEDGEIWSRPACIVADPLAQWLHEPAVNLGIPVAVFQLSGAYSTAVMHAFHNSHPQRNHDTAAAWLNDEPVAVQGLSFDCIIRRSEIAGHMRDPEEAPGFELYKGFANASMRGRWTLVNTFHELDHVGVSHLRELSGQPVWAVGPLLPTVVFDAGGAKLTRRLDSMGRLADIAKDDCVRWLDRRAHGTVLLVCLGSHFFLAPAQAHAMAHALERSGAPFIWALRRRSDGAPTESAEAEMLPAGFAERTAGRGLLIWGWAPQLMILSHPAVAAFFTHCGWNSALEALTLGVPMLTWPMFADQPFVSKLLVERLRVAVNVAVDVAATLDADALCAAIGGVLADAALRARARGLGALARAALRASGSSHHALNSFVAELRRVHESSSSPLSVSGSLC